MLKYNQKIVVNMEVLRFFLSNDWEWEESATHALHASMSEEDKKVTVAWMLVELRSNCQTVFVLFTSGWDSILRKDTSPAFLDLKKVFSS